MSAQFLFRIDTIVDNLFGFDVPEGLIRSIVERLPGVTDGKSLSKMLKECISLYVDSGVFTDGYGAALSLGAERFPEAFTLEEDIIDQVRQDIVEYLSDDNY